MRKPACFLICLCMMPHALAQVSIPKVQDNTWHHAGNALSQAGVMDAVDDVTDEQQRAHLELSPDAMHEAKVWGLSHTEEKRYLQLMKNKSATYYQGLQMTPIDILGLNAQSDAERARLATLAAQHEALKVAQNLAWNNAFHEAYKKLFEGIPVIGDFDPSPFSPHAYRPLQLAQGESLYFFIKPDDAIQTMLMVLKEAIQETPNTKLHLLFLNMGEADIQAWAARHAIPMQLVHQKRITLNQGLLAYEALALKKKSTPLLLLAKNNASIVVDLGRF
jgi:integrating conjugative element protein (TIGR03759 family)